MCPAGARATPIARILMMMVGRGTTTQVRGRDAPRRNPGRPWRAHVPRQEPVRRGFQEKGAARLHSAAPCRIDQINRVRGCRLTQARNWDPRLDGQDQVCVPARACAQRAARMPVARSCKISNVSGWAWNNRAGTRASGEIIAYTGAVS